MWPLREGCERDSVEGGGEVSLDEHHAEVAHDRVQVHEDVLWSGVGEFHLNCLRPAFSLIRVECKLLHGNRVQIIVTGCLKISTIYMIVLLTDIQILH